MVRSNMDLKHWQALHEEMRADIKEIKRDIRSIMVKVEGNRVRIITYSIVISTIVAAAITKAMG